MPAGEPKCPPGAVALVSGGLDSVAALYMTAQDGEQILALTADYGQPSFPMEQAAAAFFAHELGCEHVVIELPWMAALLPDALDAGQSSDDAVWVPNRNGVLVNAAAAIAEERGLGGVVAGFNREEAETFPDNSEAFVDATNHALEFSTAGRVHLRSQTMAMTKDETVKTLLRLGGDVRRLWSCYGPGPVHCGECPSCRRLFGALEKAGVEEDRWPEKA